jgi:hypothetical protein
MDTSESVFQVHGVDESGKVIIKRKLRRSELVPFSLKKQVACTVVLEAPSAKHSTQPIPLGSTAGLIPSLSDFIGSSLTSSCFSSALPDHCNGLSLSIIVGINSDTVG